MSGKDENPEEKESPASPSFEEVKDEEILARFVNLELDNLVSPDNKIEAGALPIGGLLPADDGWSFCRQDHVTNMSERLQQHAGGQPYGYASIRALEIRQIKDKNGKQAFYVVADPIEGDPAHVLVKRTRDYSKRELRENRDLLLEKFSEVKTRDN